MNSCLIRLYGPVKEIVRFMIENMVFAEVEEDGVRFVVKLQFDRSVLEQDELFMKENYSVRPFEYCNKMHVHVDCMDDYEEYDDIGPIERLYEFHMRRYGHHFDVHKEFEKGVCFKCKFVRNPKEFMSEFFNYFSQGKANTKEELENLKKIMSYSMMLELEFQTFDLPINILNLWHNNYDISIRSHWANEHEYLIYNVFEEDGPEGGEVTSIKSDENLQRYTELLLERGWANCKAIIDDICDMLYDTKDNFPTKINLELIDDVKDNVFKYKHNKITSCIFNTVHRLSQSEPFVLARLYARLTDMHKEFLENNK